MWILFWFSEKVFLMFYFWDCLLLNLFHNSPYNLVS
jgi:uncharacterized protein YhhL (DUF1145 family)